jgi:hypothetical protein
METLKGSILCAILGVDTEPGMSALAAVLDRVCARPKPSTNRGTPVVAQVKVAKRPVQ